MSKAQSTQTTIDIIVKSIEQGAEQLQRDNDTYADDQEAMRVSTKKLKEAIHLGMLIDKELQRRLDEGLITDKEEQKFVKQELLFPTRKRVMSLQQTLMANQQSIMTSEILISTNRELIRGTSDAKYISIVQLQNVISLVLGLVHQKNQLEKLKGLNQTTEHFMKLGAEMLDNQATEVHNLATQVGVSLEAIEYCLQHTYSAFDKIDTFKENALPGMKDSVKKMEKMLKENEDIIKKRDRGKAVRSKLVIDV